MSNFLPTMLADRGATQTQRQSTQTQRGASQVQRPGGGRTQRTQSQQGGMQSQRVAGGLGAGQGGNVQAGVLVPGQAHNWDIKAGPSVGLDYKLCKCQNPAGHPDAITFNIPMHAFDPYGVPLTWLEANNRVLDYSGKECLTRRETEPLLYQVWDWFDADCEVDHLQYLDWVARMGGQIGVDRRSTHHAGDGHQRLNINEGGLQTRVERPGAPRGGSGPVPGWRGYDPWDRYWW